MKEYKGSPTAVFHRAGFNSKLDVVNFHYDRNQWVRQDSFLPDGSHGTRFLTYVMTSEDKVLTQLDDAIPFGRFRATPAASGN